MTGFSGRVHNDRLGQICHPGLGPHRREEFKRNVFSGFDIIIVWQGGPVF